MSDRTVWIARIAGIAILLVSLILLMNLQKKLVRMTGSKPVPAEVAEP